MLDAAEYRADIDGLRAVAVLAVFGFHLFPGVLPGGFIGVDVFFVISGYLITGIVARQIALERFRMRDFFTRRVRRLAPALLFMTACSTIPALWLLSPEDLDSFARSVISQPLALQNMQFLVEGEYFRGSETKPLLHTWSLGVEEQFYLIWPLLLGCLLRRSKWIRLSLFGAVLVLSFCFSMACQWISPKLAFFGFPARAWELGAGGLACLLLKGRLVPQIGPLPSTGIRGCGLLAIIVSFIGFHGKGLWPDVRAFLPVLGTVAVLFAGSQQGTRSVLERAPLVAVGKRSYSLYLWHWPLIVYARYAGFSPRQPATAAILVVVAFVFTEVSYRFVESPVRLRKVWGSSRDLLFAAGSAALLLISAGGVGVASQGAAFRYHGIRHALMTASFNSWSGRCGPGFRLLHPRSPACELYSNASADRRVLLWGNSHAEMWVPAFLELGRTFEANVHLSARNCPPVPSNAFCDQMLEPMYGYIERRAVSDVVIAFTWHQAVRYPDATLERHMLALMRRLNRMNVTPWLLIDTPFSDEFDPRRRLAMANGTGAPTFGEIQRQRYEDSQRSRQLKLAKRLKQAVPTTRIIDPSPAFCSADVCVGGAGTVPYYRDASHLTNAGALAARAALLPIFTAAREQ